MAIRSFAKQISEIQPNKNSRQIALTKKIIKNHFYHPKVGKPICIKEILAIFTENKTLYTKSNYFQSKNWINWLFSKLKKQETTETYFYKDILEKKATEYYEEVVSRITKYTDCIVLNIDEKNRNLHHDDKELILLYLKKHNKICLLDNGFEFYKVLKNGCCEEFSELDKRIAKLKFAKNTVKQQLNFLMAEIDKKTELIKKMAHQNKRNIALAILKVKKSLEQILDNRVKSLNNLDLILLEINSIYVNILTIDGLKIGSEILAELNNNLDIKKIDENLFDISESIERSNEINDVLSADMTNSRFYVDEETLLEEIESIEGNKNHKIKVDSLGKSNIKWKNTNNVETKVKGKKIRKVTEF